MASSSGNPSYSKHDSGESHFYYSNKQETSGGMPKAGLVTGMKSSQGSRTGRWGWISSFSGRGNACWVFWFDTASHPKRKELRMS
jgi:hypothetical protein